MSALPRPPVMLARALGPGLALMLGCAKTPPETQPPEPAPIAKTTPDPDTQPDPAPEPVAQPEPDAKPEPPPPPLPPRVEAEFPLENPGSLAHFYDQLAGIDRDYGGTADGVVRVVHLGASMIGADDLTGILREKFQTRFGDGGAGLVLMSRYMSNYLHRWVKIDASGWKYCYIAYLCKGDGRYGLGGATFESAGGARTKITPRKQELGGSVSTFELWYLAQPRGGRLTVKVDDGEKETIDTRADALEDRYHPIDVEPGRHSIEVRAGGRGKARTYGIVLETDGPGIVWDQFSWLGAFTKRMWGWDDEHIAGQIAHRDPALVVFTYGGNDLRRVAVGKLTREKYAAEYLKGVKKVMAGKPEASCMIIGITDRGKSLTFTIKKEHVEAVVNAQRDAANEAGCAFFDTYTAMGGAGSIERWRKKRLAAGDLKHLSHKGRLIFAGWIYDAILQGYADHRAKATGETTPPPAS